MCALEVELKFRHDHASLRPVLEQAGFERRGVAHQVDVYFDAPDRSFARTDEALRLRSTTPNDEPTEAVLTYKGPRLGEGAKSRIEHRCAVEEAGAMEAILEAIGFAAVESVTKRRARYTRGEAVVVLDRVEGVGAFVEVELAGEVDDRARLEATLERLIDELGLAGAEREDRTYLELRLRNDSEE